MSPRAEAASAGRLALAPRRGLATDAQGRTLRSYLLLPRPKDLFKAWILPLAFAIGAVAEGGVSGDDVSRAAVVWAVLELLIYQARYQWNDIRGFEADQRHPDAATRGRLPGPTSRGRQNRRASWIMLAARLGAAAAAPLALGETLWIPVAALVVAVFATAAVYEALRSAATGYSDEVPPPVRASVLCLWIAVGAGYAIRGVTGLALAAGLGNGGAVAAAAVSLWAFGVAFVTGRWAIEALAFARSEGDRVVWRATAAQAREHSLALVRWLPDRLPAGVNSPDEWRVLMRGASGAAPWNVALIVAAAAAGLTGRALVGPVDLREAALFLAVAGIAAVPLTPERGRRAALVGGAASVGGLAWLLDAPSPAAAALPWAAVCSAHFLFTMQSLTTLGHPLRALMRGASARG